MHPRRSTFEWRSFTIERPGMLVTFVMPDAKDSLTSARTTIVIPPGSRWTPEPHWHEKHHEFFAVKQGRVRLVVNGQGRLVGPEDGVQRIEAYDVHDFWRADVDVHDAQVKEQSTGEDVIVEEWTEPG